MSWGTIDIGGLQLSETYSISDAVNASSGERSISLSGVETSPKRSLIEVQSIADDLTSLLNRVLPVTFSDKTDRNGYYRIDDVNVDIVHWPNHATGVSWSLSLTLMGMDNAVDIESRLTFIPRDNDFLQAGASWHAPAIGHTLYRPSIPSVTRPSESGNIQVYVGDFGGANPRWWSLASGYASGRVRLVLSGVERFGGQGIRVPSTSDWELNNGLVRVRWARGALEVSLWNGDWYFKDWAVFSSIGDQVTSWTSAAVLRNDPEVVTFRLYAALPSGETLAADLTLRRGARFVEVYMQRSSAIDELKIRLVTGETYSDQSASGYIVASLSDANGIKFACGSSRTFTPHVNGGVVVLNSSTLDMWIGGVIGVDASDQADALQDQYILPPIETNVVVAR